MNLIHDINDKTARALPSRPSDTKFNNPKFYKPSKELWAAVQTALNLGLPLLVTGDPGTGKTDLARHIAWYYDLGEPEIFNAQTSSTVTDLFYRYDALGHFQFAQNQGQELTPAIIADKFIRFQALGKAITEKKVRVVLLDEIDKAPRDLPNNILAALEKLCFDVPETGDPATYTFKAEEDKRPVIIMTSNSEKNLPDPFLRRVAFFHIDFPDDEALIAILKDKLEDFKRLDAPATLKHFNEIKRGDLGAMGKKPATAELLHWAALLLKLNMDTRLLSDYKSIPPDQKDLLGISYSVLAKSKDDLRTLKKALGV